MGKGAMPSSDEIDDLKTLIEDTGARILIWESEPPAEAFDLTTGLGLQNIVFEPLAYAVDDATFIEIYATGQSALADAEVQ